MKFVFFNGVGDVISAHNDDTVSEAPKGAKAVSDAQWENRCSLRLVDKKIVVAESEVTTAYLAVMVRRERNRFLEKNIDSINPLRWEEMTDKEKDKVRDYRTKLLDVPEQNGFPLTVEWPAL